MKPEYAEFIKRWCSSVQDVGLVLYIPPVVDGKPITARVPGFESDNINVSGQSPNMGEISPRDFDAGRFFTPEEDQRDRPRGRHRLQRGGGAVPRRHAVGGTMMMDGAEYTVIGVYAKAKGGFFGENGQDSAIVIPLRTAESRYPQVDRS
jgi:putative ABC transport system permease protein